MEAFEGAALAERLGAARYDSDESLSEKLGLPSSVNVSRRNERTDKIRLRMKEDFDLSSESFAAFLDEAMKKRATA